MRRIATDAPFPIRPVTQPDIIPFFRPKYAMAQSAKAGKKTIPESMKCRQEMTPQDAHNVQTARTRTAISACRPAAILADFGRLWSLKAALRR
jgi:hypothetical protein